jgi:molybdate transport system substrate-binding protein
MRSSWIHCSNWPRAVALLLGLVVVPVAAEEIRVAVASNFANAIKEIAARFERQSGHRVTLVFGSTGKHYAQIHNGAPFDAFFAADVLRPERLEREGGAIRGSRFTYAFGRLVLWSPDSEQVDARGEVLSDSRFRHLAIANPRLAPYGRAARQVLENRGLWTRLRSRLVRGENIAQTFQFVHSGSAELGFVALSQIQQPERPLPGSHWNVPLSLYQPIEQQAVLLRDGTAAREFLAFTRGAEARAIIGAHGYGRPE